MENKGLRGGFPARADMRGAEIQSEPYALRDVREHANPRGGVLRKGRADQWVSEWTQASGGGVAGGCNRAIQTR